MSFEHGLEDSIAIEAIAFVEDTRHIPQDPLAPGAMLAALLEVRAGATTLEEVAQFPSRLTGPYMDMVAGAASGAHEDIGLQPPSEIALRRAAGFVTSMLFSVAGQLSRGGQGEVLSTIHRPSDDLHPENDPVISEGIDWLRDSENLQS